MHVKSALKWRPIARHLGLADYEIDRIAAEEQETNERSYQSLRAWFDDRKGAPTASELIRALASDDVNMSDVAERVFGKELVKKFARKIPDGEHTGLVTDDHVKIVASEGSDRLMQIGRCLGYTTTELTDMTSGMELRGERNSVKLDAILQNWVRDKGDDALVERLLDACTDASIGGIVRRRFREKNLL